MASPDKTPLETEFPEFLLAEMESVRAAGNELAAAAHRVSADFDGVHRLRLALAGWYQALADERGRDWRVG